VYTLHYCQHVDHNCETFRGNSKRAAEKRNERTFWECWTNSQSHLSRITSSSSSYFFFFQGVFFSLKKRNKFYFVNSVHDSWYVCEYISVGKFSITWNIHRILGCMITSSSVTKREKGTENIILNEYKYRNSSKLHAKMSFRRSMPYWKPLQLGTLNMQFYLLEVVSSHY